ncbi:GEVED domain-containing protein [Umezakia ovalisporum]|uniref:GEVED domain-containing protein n=1 Tax=Umezakia ovalisporum FSS-43 TaxID=2740520 RepID=A0ABT6K1C8_9CYAN|nr:GEVED domain-containing protein [Umezakia ovalisporum]MDH6056164.1 GEVED domain-containing protein [Umezakia ovalisporum FSS-43]
MSTRLRTLLVYGSLLGAFAAARPALALLPHRPTPPEKTRPRLAPPEPNHQAGQLLVTYCTPTYLEGCQTGQLRTGLDGFAIEGTSLNHQNSGCSEKGYGNFTATTVNLDLGKAYTFVASALTYPDDAGNPTSIPQGVSVWLDANQDGTFGPDERVYPAPNQALQPMRPTLRKEFTVPASAKKGPTRLRVRTREYSEEYDDPCWNYFYGETHDYTVNLSDPNQPTAAVCLDVKVLLEGAFAGDAMRTQLNQRGLLPGQTPVGPLARKTPNGQPYAGQPWNDAGRDSVAAYDPDVVDWVLVSLRPKPDRPDSLAFRGAGLLRSDGRVTMVTACPVLPPDGAYHVVVEHRNHLGVMSPAPVPVKAGKLTFDFTTQQSYVRTDPPTAGQLQAGNRFLMFAADGVKAPSAQNFDINYTNSNLTCRRGNLCGCPRRCGRDRLRATARVASTTVEN